MAVHMAVKCTFILLCHLKWHIFGWCVCASESIRCSWVFLAWYFSSVFHGVHMYYLSFLYDFECCTLLSTSSEKRQAGESWSGWRRTRRGKGRRRRGSQRGGRRVHTGEPLCGKSKNELISGLYPRRESRSKEGRDGKSRSGEGKKKTPTWRLPPVPRLEKVKSLIATVIHWHFIIGEPICQ